MLKKASELWPKLKTKTNAFILCFMILNAILTVHLFMRHDINSKLALMVALIAEVLFELVMVWLFYRLKRKGAPIEKMFLAFVIPIGLLFIAFLPPQQTPDAYAHLTRAYEISQGQLVAKAGEDGVASATLPVELRHYIEHDSGYSYNANVLWQPLSGETYEEQKFYPSAAGYNFLIYAPHAVGILIGRGLRLPLYFILALGRVFSLLVFALLGYFAIKFTPRFKMLFMFLALMPMTMQLVTGYSADALTLGVAFFLVGYALKLIYDDKIKKLSRWQIAGIYVVAAIMGICKTVYFPLCALFLLIPYQKFGSRCRK